MNISRDGGGLRAFSDRDTGETEVDLEKLENPREFFTNDIVRHKLTGALPCLPNWGTVNFIESILFEVSASGVNFAECDFKDTLVKDSSFFDCRFENSMFATCFVADCSFSSCAFPNVAIHNSDFRRTVFKDCDLTNLLIKSSRFTDCEFVNCKTSNKLLEMSTLDNTLFLGTDIQVQTIKSNFGITQSSLKESNIRSGRTREIFSILSIEQIRQELERQDISPIEQLRLEYFLTEDLINGSEFLDKALNLAHWMKIYRNPGSFVELLDSFSDFVSHLYEKNRLLIHTILSMHHVTSYLVNTMPDVDEFRRVALSLGGTHMTLSRIVEGYLDILSDLSGDESKAQTFLVRGPQEADFYLRELNDWINDKEVQVTRLVPHNSPLELELTAEHSVAFISLIALFLATRTKIELTKIQERRAKIAAAGRKPRQAQLAVQKRKHEPSSNMDKIFSLTSGFEEGPQRKYYLQVMSLLPGSLLVNLRLEISTRLAGRLRRLLVDLLAPEGGEKINKI